MDFNFRRWIAAFDPDTAPSRRGASKWLEPWRPASVHALPSGATTFAATQAAWGFFNNPRVGLSQLVEPPRAVRRPGASPNRRSTRSTAKPTAWPSSAGQKLATLLVRLAGLKK